MKYTDQKKLLHILRKWENQNPHFGFRRCELGYKQTSGTLTEQLSFRILVNKKLSPQELDGRMIPKEISGIPTDVIEHSFSIECNTVNPKERQQELLGGIEIKNSKLNGNQGTLGCIVQHHGEYYGLSCHHVIFGPNHNGINGSIYQPSNVRNSIGVAEDIESSYDQFYDCAIFKLINRNPAPNTGMNSECGVLTGNKNPVVDDIVYKFGATTQRTVGKIISVGTDNKFSISNINNEDEPLSEKGDSGAVWYTKVGNTIRGVGLHLGKNESGTVLASPLVDIFKIFQISHYN